MGWEDEKQKREGQRILRFRLTLMGDNNFRVSGVTMKHVIN